MRTPNTAQVRTAFEVLKKLEERTVKSLAPSTSEALTMTDFGRESEPATNCPRHRIAVAISPPTRFPVHIRSISTNVRI